MDNLHGKGFLKVVGIFMIIGGGIALITALISLLGLNAAKQLYAGTNVEGFVTLSVILSFVGGCLELAAGIVGVKFCNDITITNVCLIFGCLTLACALGTQIISFAYGLSTPVGLIVGILLSIVLPVLYLIGAILNKKSIQVY